MLILNDSIFENLKYILAMLSQINFYVISIALIAGLGGLLFGYDTGIIANAKDQITTQFLLSDFAWSIVVSSMVLGAFMGALVSGKLADKIGCHSIILIASNFFILGALIAALSNNFISIVIGRFILGCCIGVVSFASPLYISEIAPASKRGALVLLNGIAITAGEAISFLIGYFLHDLTINSWRWMFGIGVIPAAILLIGMIYMPKSPRWLVKNNNFNQAQRVLSKIRCNSIVATELNEIKKIVENEQHGSWSILFSKSMRSVLLVGLGLAIFQQFSGVNTIMYYGPTIFNISGYSSFTKSIFATFIISLINTLFTIITALIIDHVGRRKLMLLGTLLAAISLTVVGGHFYYQLYPKWILLIALMTYTIGYCISVGSLFWLIISEIYPLHLRGLAMSFVSSIQWCANFLVALSFLPLLNFFGEALTFWLYASMCFAAFLFTMKYVPETKGISLEQIEANLAHNIPIRYLGAHSISSKRKL